MLEFAASVALMFTVVGAALVWGWNAGLRDRFGKRRDSS
jgi:hypothetical protein